MQMKNDSEIEKMIKKVFKEGEDEEYFKTPKR